MSLANMPTPPRTGRLLRIGWKTAHSDICRELFAAEDVREFLTGLAAEAGPVTSDLQGGARDLLQEAALLHVISESLNSQGDDRVLMCIRPVTKFTTAEPAQLPLLYAELYAGLPGMTAAPVETGAGLSDWQAVLVEGRQAQPLVQAEEGTHLFFSANGGIEPAQVLAVPLAPDQDELSALEARQEERMSWLQSLDQGEATPEDDPFALGRVIRIYDSQSTTLDLRTGLMLTGLPKAKDLRTFLLSSLLVPPALLE